MIIIEIYGLGYGHSTCSGTAQNLIKHDEEDDRATAGAKKIEVTGRGAGFPDKLGPVAEAFTEKINDDVTQTELSSADRQ